MKRRDIIKLGAFGMAFAPLTKLYAKSENDSFTDIFRKQFTEINYKDKNDIEFPLDIFNVPKGYTKYGSIDNRDILKFIDKDQSYIDKLNQSYILSDDKFNYWYAQLSKVKTDNDINKMCAELICATGLDRNIVIYDSQNKKHTITNGLLSSLTLVMRRNGKDYGNAKTKITDIFLRESKYPDIDISNYGFHIHKIKDDSWNYVENYAVKQLGLYYPENKNNLIIGIDTTTGVNFIMPKKDNYFGLACLNNSKVLLGAF